MKNITKFYRWIWFSLILTGVGLACSLSEVGAQVQGARETAQNAIREGQSLIGTAQALATQAGPLMETAKAFATQAGPLMQTAVAFATEQGPELLQTAQAAATQFNLGEAPSDIPLLNPNDMQDLLTSSSIVSYSTGQAYSAVVDFYQQAMPANGWSAVEGGRIETDLAATLPYEKADRTATVAISQKDGRTFVWITLQTK
jgi:hypothetical protein